MPGSRTDDEWRAMRQIIADANEVHSFLNTSIGQRLMDDIDHEVDSLTEQLKKVDAENVKEVKRIQDEIWRREYLKVWFNTKLLQGDSVMEYIESQDTIQDL